MLSNLECSAFLLLLKNHWITFLNNKPHLSFTLPPSEGHGGDKLDQSCIFKDTGFCLFIPNPTGTFPSTGSNYTCPELLLCNWPGVILIIHPNHLSWLLNRKVALFQRPSGPKLTMNRATLQRSGHLYSKLCSFGHFLHLNNRRRGLTCK